MPYVIATTRPPEVVHDAAGNETYYQYPADGFGFEQAHTRAFMHVRLWNIGRGPAMVTDVQLRLDLDDEVVKPLHFSIPLIPDGTLDHENWLMPKAAKWWIFLDSDTETPGELRIYYTHATGTPYMTTSRVVQHGPGLRCLDYERTKSDGRERPFDP
jgi:hypothetical protein